MDAKTFQVFRFAVGTFRDCGVTIALGVLDDLAGVRAPPKAFLLASGAILDISLR